MLASIRNSVFRTQAVRPVVTARFLSTPTASQVDDPVQTKFFLGELTNLVESVPDAVPPPGMQTNPPPVTRILLTSQNSGQF